VQDHLRADTYRADRHGALPANVVSMPLAPTLPWQPEDSDLGGIGPAGRELIARMLDHYEFTLAEGLLLLEAGQAAAALSAVRTVDRSGRALRELATLDRMEIAWQKQLAALLAQLKVSE
jgi:hypothetical protein